MSLRYEQYHSLWKTQKFLRELLHHSTRPKKVSEIEDRAYNCLRHFPFLDAKGKPMFSQDDFECPDLPK